MRIFFCSARNKDVSPHRRPDINLVFNDSKTGSTTVMQVIGNCHFTFYKIWMYIKWLMGNSYHKTWKVQIIRKNVWSGTVFWNTDLVTSHKHIDWDAFSDLYDYICFQTSFRTNKLPLKLYSILQKYFVSLEAGDCVINFRLKYIKTTRWQFYITKVNYQLLSKRGQKTNVDYIGPTLAKMAQHLTNIQPARQLFHIHGRENGRKTNVDYIGPRLAMLCSALNQHSATHQLFHIQGRE